MKRLAGIAVLAALSASALSGCATVALGSAPSPDPNYTYVVGRRGGLGAAWICPAIPDGQQCALVDVIRH